MNLDWFCLYCLILPFPLFLNFSFSLPFGVPTLAPPLVLPLQYSLYPITASCFCVAVSLVDTMKTGRIHYLAPYSSHPLWFSLPTHHHHPQHPSPPFHHSSFQQWIHFFIMLLFSPLLWISLILSCFNLFSFLCAASLPFRTTACTSLLMNELLLSCFSLATKTEDYKPFLTLFCLRHVEKCFCRGKHSRIVTDELKLRKMETKKRRCKGGIAGDKIFKHSKTPSEWVKVAL